MTFTLFPFLRSIQSGFKATEETETVAIVGKISTARKSLKAKEVNDVIAKHRNDPSKIFP